ncbi:extradiol dioxygenase [Skermanella stibiiresistens SB22]|uniref:Extradiol dioxygenase n=1 Tax=Skermanella stibiiresistens SB22 TaxID=1385369 RepID=W9H6P7_9PROT|nr:VOC family protein [Skermanella stibiiresistens]EWY41694.1 extradiol dioxygenase [Skermanella stibiiresistens SB22]
MSRIVHIALKCGDLDSLESATKFYEDIFGIYQTKSTHARGHLSRHMTDGNIDLALMLYDSEDEKEAKLAGAGPRIHHIGIEVDDRPSMIKKIEDNGGSIYSDRAEGALKYRSADGTLGEIVAVGRYLKKDMSKLARISRVSLQVNDVDKAAMFYENVFGFQRVGTADGGGGRSREMTDGDTTLFLFEEPSIEQPGIQYWGLEVTDPKAVAEKVEEYGGVILANPGSNIVRFRAPDGNMAELVGSAA